MNVSVNWSNIRHLNGSREKAFEELCCQLAAFAAEWLKNRVFTGRVRLSCPKLVDVNSL